MKNIGIYIHWKSKQNRKWVIKTHIHMEKKIQPERKKKAQDDGQGRS